MPAYIIKDADKQKYTMGTFVDKNISVIEKMLYCSNKRYPAVLNFEPSSKLLNIQVSVTSMESKSASPTVPPFINT